MRARRWCAALVATTTLCAPAMVAAGGTSALASESSASPSSDVPLYGDPANVVPGRPGSGQIFWPWDFDTACVWGYTMKKNVDQWNAVAKVIQKSGRRAIFTIAPNKSSVYPEDLDMTKLPHGACDLEGLDAQMALLDHYSSKHYLPLRKKLAAHPMQTYWKNDLHWSTVGGSVFAKALATKLKPALGKRQKYRTTHRELSKFTAMAGYPGVAPNEIAPARLPKDFVTVTTTAGVDPTVGMTYDFSWKTTPARKAWRGNTLLLGDSMTFTAIENLRPVFANGRFMWHVHHQIPQIVDAILQSDTVVMEMIQWSLTDVTSYAAGLEAQLRTALGMKPRQP